jgi:hypothetical protein
MQRRGRLAAGALGLALLGSAAAGAQDAKVDELAPPPIPVLLYLVDQPVVTVVFDGDYGPVRATGVLDAAPKDAFRLTDPSGRSREVTWKEVRELSLVRAASEGLPTGSFTVRLTSDPASTGRGSTGGGGYLSPALSAPGLGQDGWRLLRLPEGEISIQGEGFGKLAVPADRVTQFVIEPIRGQVAQMPKGSIRLEVLKGREMSVPLQEVVSLRRDLAAGTVSVSLADGQLFTGKLLELPKVSFAVQEAGRERPPIALDRVVQLEVTLPAAAGRLGGRL